MTDDHSNPSCPIKLAHGTTTLAFRFQGGIVRYFPMRLEFDILDPAGYVLMIIGIDCVHRFTSNSRQLDCQSNSQEGHSCIAVESG